MIKHGNFLGGLEKLGLVEGDGAQPMVSTPKAPDAAAPMPLSSALVSGAGIPLPSPPGTAPLTADDQERLKAIEAQVYAGPSSYIVFRRVRETLGNTSDLRNVFNVLDAANPGVTPAKVLADIDQHLAIIEQKGREMSAQVTQARADRIDGPAKEIADLTKANQDALSQITQRGQRIKALQDSVADAERAITSGAQRFTAIEDALRAPLLATKQLLNPLN